MKVPFVDLKAQYQSIREEINSAIQNVLDSTSFILGKSVADFERAFAVMHNVKYCYGTSSGTDGNHLCLWAIGTQPGDEIIIPANTFIATVWGATLCGAKPVFIDCHLSGYNIDPSNLVKAITNKTKAIVAVHLYGQPADIEDINVQLSILNFESENTGVFKHKKTGQVIYLVEDCAQSHMAEYKGQRVGGLSYASSFSFYPGKNLGAYGEAGAVCTNDEFLADKFKIMRDHGSQQKYTHITYGHNYRMEGIQGAVLSVKLKYLNKWIEMRRKAAKLYYDMLSNIEQIVLPKEMEYARHVYHLYVIRVKSGREKRDSLLKYLSEKEISTGLHYPIPCHLQPCFSHLGYKKGDFLNSETLAEQGISLPMYPELKNEQIYYVCDMIKNFLS
ncbi:MAG: DegT/DnrJ/EryC1/StrS family aminotransferase [Ignavibacteria bacterium]|nr:DegT/DnrJ/EryC1/StrS family aminotransferase [Ignavibacteria bacterium]